MQALWLWSVLWLMPSGRLARSSINGILMSLSLLMRWTPGVLVVQANTVGMTGSSSQPKPVHVITEMSIPRWQKRLDDKCISELGGCLSSLTAYNRHMQCGVGWCTFSLASELCRARLV